MHESTAYELLQSVKQQLAGYRVVQCALAHERVVSLSRNEYGISPTHPGWQIDLKGFCDRSSRQQRLGCAHTTANERYRNLVGKLIDAGIAADLVAPLAEVDEIVMSIYRSDHEKARLEKQCAVFREEGHGSELHEAELQLNALLGIHFNLLDRLGTLHRHILIRIDALLGDCLPASAK
jgi:hypothetical protein